MNKDKVVLIGDTKRFMVNSLVKGIRENDIEVTAIPPSVAEIRNVDPDIKLYIIFMGDDMSSDAINYLYNQMNQNGYIIYAIGSNEELNSLYNFIPEAAFKKTYLRPLNIQDLVVDLQAGFYDVETQASKKKILVVDDDGVMLRTIKGWLEFEYSVYMANSGVDAITFLAKNKVDLVLLDYEMPITDGPTVLSMIRAQKELQDLPVMFLTAKDDKESVVKVLELHPEKYLLKNSDPGELVASIDEFFMGR
jgi:CheY-like chemotaxis protein